VTIRAVTIGIDHIGGRAMLDATLNLDSGGGGNSLDAAISFGSEALGNLSFDSFAMDDFALDMPAFDLSQAGFDALDPIGQGDALRGLDDLIGRRDAGDSLLAGDGLIEAPNLPYDLPAFDDGVTLDGQLAGGEDIVVTANPVLAEALSPSSMSAATFDRIFLPADDALRAERDAHFQATGEDYSILPAEIDLANRANVAAPVADLIGTPPPPGQEGGYFLDYGLGFGPAFNLHVDREGVTGSVGAGLFGRLTGGYASDYQALVDARAQDKVFIEGSVSAPVVGTAGAGVEYSYGTDKLGGQVAVGPVAVKETFDTNSGALSAPELSFKNGEITGKSDGGTTQVGFEAGGGWLHQGATREWAK
jgi:hypothetical protein